MSIEKKSQGMRQNGCSGCTKIFETSPLAPMDFEVLSTIGTHGFYRKNCTRRSKFLNACPESQSVLNSSRIFSVNFIESTSLKGQSSKEKTSQKELLLPIGNRRNCQEYAEWPDTNTNIRFLNLVRFFIESNRKVNLT